VTLEQDAVGRLSRIDAMQMQAMALATRDRRRTEKERILAALRRIESGDYGWCVACGEDIAPARLRNDPTATHCISCAR
jgi:DnaK suppressor protein